MKTATMRPPDPTILPDYYMLKLDERQHWHAEIQSQTRAIYGVYAFDRSSHTHLCEYTPSYELRWIATDYEEIEEIAEDEDRREALNEKILSASYDSEPVTYMHVSDVEALIKRLPERVRKVEIEPDEDTDPFEEIMEGWNTGGFQW